MSFAALRALAALGTERLQSPPPAPDPLLEATWAQLDWQQPELALLRAAALAASARLAGVRPLADARVEPPAEVETRPVCAPAVQDALRQILEGRGSDLDACLGELLARVADRKLRLPARLVLPLLQRALDARDLRDAAMAVSGARGSWLARQPGKWQRLLAHAEPQSDAFATGTPQERLAWLRAARRTDPAGAAAALAGTWAQESGEERAKFAELLAEQPHPADEPLLTQALRDRRREVRLGARRALRQLPDSAFVARARQRARNLLVPGDPLELQLPAAFAPEWRDDGVEETAPKGVGIKAFWVRQLLAAVPLADWPQLLGATPGTVFAAATRSDHRDVFASAWLEASADCRDLAVLAPFAEFVAQLDPWPDPSVEPGALLAGLIADTPALAVPVFSAESSWLPGRRELPLALRILTVAHGVLTDDCAATLQRRLPEALPAALARPNAQPLGRVISRLPAAACAPLLEALERDPQLPPAAEPLLRTLQFRCSYLKALTEPAPPEP